MLSPQARDFYRRPAAITTPGRHGASVEALPDEPAALVRTVQGLLLHEHLASAYGVTLPHERRSEPHLRFVEPMLNRLLAHDDRPLTVARPAEKRLVGVCRHFALLLVAFLRAKGVPARARCGFASYFEPGRWTDHWIAERWDEATERWVMVDAQLDEVQRRALGVDFDPLDVPCPARFLTAGEAWARCRDGAADPAAFGIFDLRGPWFVAGNVLRDAAALNRMEMLPWDSWGAMPRPDEPLAPDRSALFDRLAALTRDPDASLAEIATFYEEDERLRVPAVVFNALLDRVEPLEGSKCG